VKSGICIQPYSRGCPAYTEGGGCGIYDALKLDYFPNSDGWHHLDTCSGSGGGPRCTLTPPDPQLKGAWYPGGFNPCTYQVKKPVSKLCLSNATVRRYAPAPSRRRLARWRAAGTCSSPISACWFNRWGRRALTPPDPQLKGAWYPCGFNPCNPCTYQVKNRFHFFCLSSTQLAPLRIGAYSVAGRVRLPQAVHDWLLRRQLPAQARVGPIHGLQAAEV
jgi:hypothetical protein